MPKFKKAITLVEILISITVLGVLSLFYLNIAESMDFKEQKDLMKKDLGYIVTNGIFNTNGYYSTKGGDCSSTIDARDISAIRIKRCAELHKFKVEETSSVSTNGWNSYFIFLEKATAGMGNCKAFFDDAGDFTVNMHISCENIEKKRSIENMLATYFLDNHRALVKDVFLKATSLTELKSGTRNDGKLTISFTM